MKDEWLLSNRASSFILSERGGGVGDILPCMGSADLHLHTSHGDGLIELPALLAYVEERTDLDVIAVTEHDQIDAALRLRELHARGRYRFEVVVGAEVTTVEGHLL